MLQSTPLGAQRPRRHTYTIWQSGSDTKLSHPHIGSAVARYCPLWAPSLPSRFWLWELTNNFPVDHPSWDCSSPNSLNFGVPKTPKLVSSPKASC
ncbi:unnamed protein product [Prunus armeniaca]